MIHEIFFVSFALEGILESVHPINRSKPTINLRRLMTQVLKLSTTLDNDPKHRQSSLLDSNYQYTVLPALSRHNVDMVIHDIFLCSIPVGTCGTPISSAVPHLALCSIATADLCVCGMVPPMFQVNHCFVNFGAGSALCVLPYRMDIKRLSLDYVRVCVCCARI